MYLVFETYFFVIEHEINWKKSDVFLEVFESRKCS